MSHAPSSLLQGGLWGFGNINASLLQPITPLTQAKPGKVDDFYVLFKVKRRFETKLDTLDRLGIIRVAVPRPHEEAELGSFCPNASGTQYGMLAAVAEIGYDR